MIVFRDREKTRRFSSPSRVAIFFFWVILVFSLVTFFLSIHNESAAAVAAVQNRSRNRSRSRSRHSIKPSPPPSLPPQLQGSLRDHSFSRVLFHAPLSSFTTTVMKIKNGYSQQHSSVVYEDDKRIIHTGPNPLHN
ncbi:hypothetical protein HN51_065980 [Arachis hypogaea]